MTQPATSFRDPEGVCCRLDGRVLRLVTGEATRLGAVPVTTPKDVVRLPAAQGTRIESRPAT